MKQHLLIALVTVAGLTIAAQGAQAQTARDRYNRALAQERTVRDDASKPTLAQLRRAVAAYEAIVRRHPASGYADNALWQAANLASLTFERFGDEADRRTSTRLFAHLSREYPSSKLAAQIPPQPVVTTGAVPADQKSR